MLGAVLVTGALMLGVYTIVEAGRQRLGLGADARPRRRRARAARRLRRPPGDRRATPLLPLRLFRSRNVSGANVIQMLMVAGMFGMFFLGALYLRARARLRRDRDRPRVPARVGRRSACCRCRLRRAARHCASAPAPCCSPASTLIGARRCCAVGAAAGRRRLRRRPAAGDAAARHRRGHLVPADHDAGDVRGDAAGLRAALRPRQHDAAGRRRARPGRARHAGDGAQRADR